MLSKEQFQAALDDFSEHTLEKAKSYFHQKKVLYSEIRRDGEEWVISGKVRGSRPKPYSVQITVGEERDGLVFDETCSCPLTFGCKHAAALLMSAMHDAPLSSETNTFHTPDLIVLPPPPPILPDQWNQWLDHLELAAKPKAPETNDYSPLEQERLLYILKPQPDSGLTVEFAIVRAAKTGGFGQPRNCYLYQIINNDPLLSCILPSDRTIVRRLALAQQQLHTSQPKLYETEGSELLEQILATGRCKWRGPGKNHPILALGERRPAKAIWNLDEQGRQTPAFELTPPATAILRLSPPWYIDEKTGECGRMETGLPNGVAEAWLLAPPLEIEQSPLLETTLSKRFGALPLPPPRRVEVVTVQNVKPRFCLRLHSMEVNTRFLDPFFRRGSSETPGYINLAHLEFDYNGSRVPATSRNRVSDLFRDGKRIKIIRDLKSESAAEKELLDKGLNPARYAFFHGDLEANTEDMAFDDSASWFPFLMEVVPQLRANGWEIEIDPNFQLRLVEPEEWYTDAKDSGIDWFGVEIGVQLDGQKINLLPLLVNQIRAQPQLLDPEFLTQMGDKGFIRIPMPDGRVLPFPARRLREMLGVLLELFDEKPLDGQGRIKLSRLRAAELSGIAGEANWRWKGSEELKQLSDKLRNFKGIQAVAPSENLKASLRPYQQDGLSWLQFLREYELGGILADDMGLGKTVQTLAHLLHEKESGRADCPSLVIAPTSLMTNWRQETERFTPSLKVLVLHGLERKQHFEKIRDYDLIVTSYPLLPRDEAILLKERFHYVVLDEAQYIKNPKTKYAQIVCQLRAQHHLCLTGTPMENHLGELWSQFNFLLPGFLGDEVRFRKLFRNPIERGGNDERRKILARRISPFILRRRKQEVVKELPPKNEILQNVELSGAQRDLYETIRLAMHAKVRDEVAKKGMSRSHIVILDALLKLRQVCCDPRLIKLDSARKVKESAKLELLMDLLPEMLAEGRRILLFSQFTSMLALIEAELKKLGVDYALLTGETTDRATPIERFQQGKVPLFLISLKAGGTGLNLTTADTVIHYDPWWNPAVENQATDRAHRIGQTKSVFVYKLMTVGTVEERILELQRRKRDLVEGLLDENRKESLKLSSEDLDVLFAPLK